MPRSKYPNQKARTRAIREQTRLRVARWIKRNRAQWKAIRARSRAKVKAAAKVV